MVKEYQLDFLETYLEELLIPELGEYAGWPDRFGEYLRHWSTDTLNIKIPTLSLFSGAGGLDIGFSQAGFDINTAIEIEETFTKTLESNSKSNGLLGDTSVLTCDIRDFHPPSNYEVDFIIGGPPCQTFSAAGRRAGGVLGTSDTRGILFTEYVRLLRHLRPRGFLFENVYGITGAENGAAWKEIVDAFSESGYRIFYRILDAADYGVPQHRERLFILGIQEGSYEFPRPTHGPDSPGKRPHFTAKKAIADLVWQDANEPKSINGRYGHLLNDIPPGLNYSFYTEKMGHPTPIFAWRSKFSDFLYKADPNAPTRTIKAQGGLYTGPFHWDSRPFTIAEFKRLQTFPDEYIISGGRQAVIQQIGNSVPPQLARILALSILDQVFGIEIPVHLPKLPPGAQLGFRKRKHQRTTEYAKKAKAAILEIKHNPQGERLPQHREYYANVDRGFNYQVSEMACFPLKVKINRENQRWEFLITSSEQDRSGFEMKVLPSQPNWGLPVHEIVMRGMSLNVSTFVGAWKAFERELALLNLKADLVQLSGYYQYTPTFHTTMAVSKLPKPKYYWEAVKNVVMGVGTRQQLTVGHLSDLWGVDVQNIPNIMEFMRSLGYEIRNHNTNPRIPEGKYLVPYTFPTLNPMSVQLRKNLRCSGGSINADRI